MTLDDFVLLPLSKRIAWLHSSAGPKGKLSHDRFAEALGIPNRQTIIGWENGREPSKANADKLAEFSGFPAWVFRRREAEEAAAETIARRLRDIEGELDGHRRILYQVYEALRRGRLADGIEAPRVPEAPPAHAHSGRRKAR